MQITDGTTTLTFTGTTFDDFVEIEQKTDTTAGGNLRTQIAGKRFKVVEGIRITASEWLALSTLLTNGATTYYYTPTVTPAYLLAIMPMPVNIEPPKKKRQAGGGEKKYYVELVIQSVGYL